MVAMNFKGRHIVSIKEFPKEEIEHILDVAEKMRPIAEGEETSKALDGKILANLFFEPSTRTRLSFESAMLRLGGGILGFSEPKGTSVAKGETLADTIRMAASYADAIVVRHPNEGSARLAAEFSGKPILNAGDGAGQHPTQTLLDLFTIRSEKGKIGGNNIVFVGDLKYGRTVHSLAYALSLFGANMTFVAPPSLQMPGEVLEFIRGKGLEPTQSASLEDAIADADVLYVTRIQKERFPDLVEYKKMANIYRVTPQLLSSAKQDVSVMHPLPRVNEISPEVDATPNAVYFRQAFNGVLVRMALLLLVLTGRDSP